jgi:hypothetical protein
MKRILFVIAFAALFTLPGARAQNLVGDAVRQELEDRLRRVERDLEAVKEANDSLRKKLGDLQRNSSLVEESAAKVATASSNALQTRASKEELSHLREALKESEHRREADKKLFLEKFEELRKLMASAPPASAFSTPVAAKLSREKSDSGGGKSKAVPSGVPDTGVYHLVEKNQTALEILKAYNDDQKAKGRTGKITLKQLEAANSGANMDRLRTGQKLFIPIPEK